MERAPRATGLPVYRSSVAVVHEPVNGASPGQDRYRQYRVLLVTPRCCLSDVSGAGSQAAPEHRPGRPARDVLERAYEVVGAIRPVAPDYQGYTDRARAVPHSG